MRDAIETNSSIYYQRVMGPAALLLAMALPSCVTADEPSDPPLATLAAEHGGELGVARWEVREEGETVRVIGLDESAARRAEMVVRRVEGNPDRVQVESLFPQQGVFELGRGGVVDGAPSDLLQRLGVALSADMGERSVPIEASPEVGLGTAVSGLFLQNEGHIALGWSFFGYAADVDVGWLCWGGPSGLGTRNSYAAYSNYGASCWVKRWISDWAYDCRMTVHYGIGGFSTDTCNWFIYAD